MIKREAVPTGTSWVKKVLAGVGVLVILVTIGLAISAGLDAYRAPIRPGVEYDKISLMDRRYYNEFMNVQAEMELTRPQKKQLAEVYTKFLVSRQNRPDANEQTFARYIREREAQAALHKEVKSVLTPEQGALFDAMQHDQMVAIVDAARDAFEWNTNLPMPPGVNRNMARQMLDQVSKRVKSGEDPMPPNLPAAID